MRIAIPKGRLFEGITRKMSDAGIYFNFKGKRNYYAHSNLPDITGALLKARAIPQMIALGNFEAGFCGLDLAKESSYSQVIPVLDLRINKVTLVVAVLEQNQDILKNPPKRPLLIATEYERLASQWAVKHNLSHIVIQTWGSTEAYAQQDADIIFDCVDTGATLTTNNLVIIDEIMISSTYLFANKLYYNSELGSRINEIVDRLTNVGLMKNKCGGVA